MHNGHLPHALYICHKCNNKKCVNPKHLYAGTAKDNARDFKNAPYYAERMKQIKANSNNFKKAGKEFSEKFLLIRREELEYMIQIKVEEKIRKLMRYDRIKKDT